MACRKVRGHDVHHVDHFGIQMNLATQLSQFSNVKIRMAGPQQDPVGLGSLDDLGELFPTCCCATLLNKNDLVNTGILLELMCQCLDIQMFGILVSTGAHGYKHLGYFSGDVLKCRFRKGFV